MKRKKYVILFRIGIASYVIICIVFLVGLVFHYLLDPRNIIHEERASSTPETVEVEYIAYACGNFYPRLWECRPKIPTQDDPETEECKPLLLALPPDMPSPEGDTPLEVSGNRFRLRGFRYRWVDEIGNPVRKCTRFDVIEWEVVVPYQMWGTERDEDGLLEIVTSSEPVSYRINGVDYSRELFTLQKYNPCSFDEKW